MKKFDGYLSQISSILIDAYSHGYEEGFEKAKARFGERDRCPNCGAKMDGGADIKASFGDAPEAVGYQLIKE